MYFFFIENDSNNVETSKQSKKPIATVIKVLIYTFYKFKILEVFLHQLIKIYNLHHRMYESRYADNRPRFYPDILPCISFS